MSVDVFPRTLTAGADYWWNVVAGNVEGVSVDHKFGRNPSVGNAWDAVSIGALYQTPQVAGATTLRVAAGDANDSSAGSGAREITLQGLDTNGALVTEAIPTAGASASAATTTVFLRLHRAWVSAAGTYLLDPTGSHADDIVIENGAGGTTWLTIDATDIARGQSEVGLYTIPLGLTGFVCNTHISVDSNSRADIMLIQRQGVLLTSPPYGALRLQQQWGGVSGEAGLNPMAPLGPFPELTDIGFLAKSGTPSEVDIDFQIILIDNP